MTTETTTDWYLTPFDIYNADDAQYAALHRFACAVRAERLPHDPPIGLEEFMARTKSIPPVIEYTTAVAMTESGEIIGQADALVMPGDENPHLMQTSLAVHPAHRRQGIGRRLLGFVADEAQRRNRSLIIVDTHSTAPDGERFALKMGARRGMEGASNQLILAEVDSDLIERWLANAPTATFELSFLEGPYPEEILPGMAELFNVMQNDQPRDDVEMEDMQITPELLREMEKMQFSAGGRRWTVVVRERSSGDFAGYSEITWHPNRPTIVNQQGTGVFPRFRGHGLGRWLKAAMIERILAERPEVQYIRTNNANSNAPMLRINEELGFRAYYSTCVWQIETDALLRFLG